MPVGAGGDSPHLLGIGDRCVVLTNGRAAVVMGYSRNQWMTVRADEAESPNDFENYRVNQLAPAGEEIVPQNHPRPALEVGARVRAAVAAAAPDRVGRGTIVADPGG